MSIIRRFGIRGRGASQLQERIYTDNFGIVLAEGSSSAFAEIYTRTLTPAALQVGKSRAVSLVVSFDYQGPTGETSTCRLFDNDIQLSDNKRVSGAAATACSFQIWNLNPNISHKLDIEGMHTSGNAGSATVTNFQVNARLREE